MRGMALAFAKRPQPLTIALADTHPGNFMVDRAGLTWISGRCISARRRSTLRMQRLRPRRSGTPDVCKVLSRAETQGLYDLYLEKVGEKQAPSLQPWLVPMRRPTWLRTTFFMARWLVQTRSVHDPDDPTQYVHRAMLRRDTIQSIRSERMS